MTAEHPEDWEPTVPISELWELCNQFKARETANNEKAATFDSQLYGGIAAGRARSAAELEELIESYER